MAGRGRRDGGRSGRPRIFPATGPDSVGPAVYVRLPRRMRGAVELLAEGWGVSLSTALRTLLDRAIRAEVEREVEREAGRAGGRGGERGGGAGG